MLLAGDPVISEFVAHNVASLLDEDSDPSDWIEVFNRGTDAVDLGGWFLTNDAGDLTKWTIPTGTVLGANASQVIFASGKDRVSVGSPLHTNFELDEGGGYLALVEPTGPSVVSQFDAYPAVASDESFGRLFPSGGATLVSGTGSVRVRVPNNDSLGLTWTGGEFDEPFDDSILAGWTQGTGGVGFESPTTSTGFRVTSVTSIANPSLPTSVAAAEALIGGQFLGQSAFATYSTINFLYDGSIGDPGHFGGDAPFPFNATINAHRAAATVWVPIEDAGVWTFDANHGGPVRLLVDGAYVVQSEYFFGGGDIFGSRELTPGPHAIDLLYYDSQPESALELTAAKGNLSVFDSSFKLVGSAAAGALKTGGLQQFVQTNVLGAMRSVNTSAYLRYPFQVVNPSDVLSLTLDVDYEDGFTAFLNGQVVGSVNAPDTPAFDSAATSDPRYSTVRFDATALRSALRAGPNVLAIQGLTSQKVASRFFIRPQLTARVAGAEQLTVFATPTPGEINRPADPLISEFMAVNDVTLTDEDGDSPDWIELHNPGSADINLAHWHLTDDPAQLSKWTFPSVNLPAGGYLVVFASNKDRGGAVSELHTNFTLKDDEDYLALVRPDGATIASAYRRSSGTLPDQFEDLSFGIDGAALASGQTDPRVYFMAPTPGADNGSGLNEVVGPVTFSAGHQIFEAPLTVAIANGTPGTSIYYTTDGSVPSPANGTLYTTPLNVASTTTLRAAAFKSLAVPSQVATETYLHLADVIAQSPTGVAPPGFPSAPINGQVFNYGIDPDIVNDPVYGPQLVDSLKALPSLSIVTDLDNLFDPATGIYVNAFEQGQQWEKPISIELIQPDGSPGFHADAGLRIRGQTSAFPQNPRHSLRVFFRDQYGDDQLKFPLFGDEGPDQFDSFDLRLDHLYSWSYAAYDNATFVRDAFSTDTQRDMGQPYIRSKFYHLYLNGQYWGLYQLQERIDSDFAASNFGGDPADYDVIKADNTGFVAAASDGSIDAWQQLYNATIAGYAGDAQYFAVQGRDPDGTLNPARTNLLDVDNVIDYMTVMYYVGQWDGPITASQANLIVKNWFGYRNRAANEGFKFLAYDSETSLEIGAFFNHLGPYQAGGLPEYFNPQYLHQRLMDNANYRMRFADRLSAYWSEGGILDPDVAAARQSARAGEISQAVVAESARWGDTIRSTPFTAADWQGAVDDINATYFPQRERYLRARMEELGWYPTVDAPVLNSSGGTVPPGHEVTAAVPSRPTVPEIVPIAFDSTGWSYLDDGSDQGDAWRESAFNDGAWIVGDAEFGFGGGDEATVVNFGPNGNNKFVTTYLRRHFTATGVDQLDSLRLTLLVDDGAVVYLNGQEIARTQIPAGQVGYRTLASVDSDDFAPFFTRPINGVNQKEFVVPASALVEGDNVLAIEYHVYAPNDTDMSLNVELRGFLTTPAPPVAAEIYYTTDGSDPRALDGAISPTAVPYQEIEPLVDRPSAATYHVPTSGFDAIGWQAVDFDDSTWTAGTAAAGFDTGVVDEQPGFTVRTVDARTGTFATVVGATNLLNGVTAGFTVASDTTRIADSIVYGDDGNPFPGTFDREHFAMRVTATVTIPIGTWTVSVVSEDGFRLTMTNTTFTARVNDQAFGTSQASNQVVYSVPRNLAATLGRFTVAGSPRTSSITLDYFATTFTDRFEFSIAPGVQTAYNPSLFNALADGQNGWRVTTTLGASSFLPHFDTNLDVQMRGVNASVYSRMPFSASNLDDISGLALTMKGDDGFVAYLNGTEVVRRNAPANVLYNSAATTNRRDTSTIDGEWFDLSAFKDLLVEGVNVLAIQGLNVLAANGDFLLAPKLEALLVADPIVVNQSMHLRTRALVGNTWTPLTETRFFVQEPATAANLAITEINYHPADPTAEELAVNPAWTDSDFEYIELTDSGAVPIDLSGVRFTEGITFAFASGTLLDPGQFVVLARNPLALAARYGAALAVGGTFSGSLNNAGEQLKLVGFAGATIRDFVYDDSPPWPTPADGLGAALEVVSTAGDYNDSDNWNSSDEYLGSPGRQGTGPIDDVVINEVLTNSDLPLVDSVELLNKTDAPIDVGGWYLSDSTGNYKKYRIPDGTLIGPGEYLVIDESAFNPTPETPGLNDFSFSGAHGDDVWLMKADGTGKLLRFVNDVQFNAAPSGESLGRWPNGSGDLYPMASRTFGQVNSGPRTGPIIISEIMYNATAAAADDDLEFIELTNTAGAAVDMSGWKFSAGVDFAFPAGATLAAGDSLLVMHFNPADPANATRLAAFQDVYGPLSGVPLYGGYAGVLDDGGETLRLVRPDTPPPTEPLVVPFVLVDEVPYDDDAPWPTSPDGAGASLSRVSGSIYGREVTNWLGNTPSPGTFSARVLGRHVFYNNSAWDGGNPDATPADDDAIATDKTALLPGQTATFANYTSFTKGITGVMIDVSGLPGTPTPADFAFAVGNTDDVATWTPLATAPTVSFRPGAGEGGSTRITLTWPTNAIRKQWLEVRMLANSNTALPSADVFYFGNAVGEAGDSAANAQVNAGDELRARGNPRNIANPAPVTFPYDYNRDKQVNAGDQLTSRGNGTNLATALRLISPPATAATAPAAAGLLADANDGLVEMFADDAQRRRARR